MERIYTWIHENYMKRLERKAEKTGASKYKVAQLLIEKGLDKEQEFTIGLTIAFYFFIYAIIVATIIQFI